MKTLFTSSSKAAMAAIVLAGGVALSAPANATSCGSEYVVEGGDTLSRIAMKCEVGTSDILEANADLRNPNRLAIGQKLAMPQVKAQDAVKADEAEEKTAAAEAKPEAGPRTLSGLVVSGTRCALLETENGDVYGLTGSNKVFASGAKVTVTGTMRGVDECGPQKMLIVSDLVQG